MMGVQVFFGSVVDGYKVADNVNLRIESDNSIETRGGLHGHSMVDSKDCEIDVVSILAE